MKLKVKDICKLKGITLAELAQSMEIAPESLSRSINGNPSLTTMENIATALGVEITELFSTSVSSGFTCPNCGTQLELKIKGE